MPDGLVIGDDAGAPESANVLLNADNQILGHLTVNPSGLLFFENGHNLIMTGGLTIKSGVIQTGAGKLTLGGVVTVPDGSVFASIQGHLSLGLFVARVFNVGQNSANAPALEISANITDAVLSTAGTGLTKQGQGWLRLAGSNSYTGDTNVNDGRLTAANPLALGPAAQGIVSITQHGQLHIASPITIGKQTLTVQTDNTVPAILCETNGVTTLTGSIALAGGTNQIATAPGCTLQINQLTGPGDLIINDQGNGVVFTGPAVNTNSGNTLVSAGTLRAKDPGGVAFNAITLNNATLDLQDQTQFCAGADLARGQASCCSATRN